MGWSGSGMEWEWEHDVQIEILNRIECFIRYPLINLQCSNPIFGGCFLLNRPIW